MTTYCSDRQRVEIAKNEYKNLRVKRKIRLKDGTLIGYVAQINDNPTGKRACANYNLTSLTRWHENIS